MNVKKSDTDKLSYDDCGTVMLEEFIGLLRSGWCLGIVWQQGCRVP